MENGWISNQFAHLMGFPGGSDGKQSACNAGDWGSIPGSGGSLEKGMATHSSILAWRSPWIEELGSLQSMGSQRAGHDWATNTLNCFSNTGQWVYAIQDGPHLLLVGTAICFGKMWVYPKNLDTSPFYSFLLSSSKQYLAQGQCPVIFFDRWIFRHLNKSTNELIRPHFSEVLWSSVLGTGHNRRL